MYYTLDMWKQKKQYALEPNKLGNYEDKEEQEETK